LMGVTNAMKGPTLGASPTIVILTSLIAPVLLLSTKLPPSVHTGEQVAVPALPEPDGAMVATTFSVMISAFAAPTLTARMHTVAASAALSFNFIVNPSVMNRRCDEPPQPPPASLLQSSVVNYS
jgi:hypothetical protein